MADTTGSEPNSADVKSPDEESGFGDAFAERASGTNEPEADTSAAKEQVAATYAEKAQEPADNDQGEKEFDPWAGLSEQQKAHFETLRHSESTYRGRASALARQLNEVQAAKPAPEAKAQEADDGKPSRAERLKQAAEEYPDAVGPLVEAIADLTERMEASQPKAPQQGAEPDPEVLEREYQALEAKHPDYRQIGADPSYANWVGTKSEAIKALATSYSADDVASVITLFKAERQASQATPAHNAQTDTQAQKRQRQLEGSRAVTSRGAPASSGPAADDFNAAFNAKARGKA